MNPETTIRRRTRAMYLSRIRNIPTVMAMEEQGATLDFYEHGARGLEIVVERAVVCACGHLRRAEGPRLPAGNDAHRCHCGTWTAPAMRVVPMPATDKDGGDGSGLYQRHVADAWNDMAAAAALDALNESLAYYGPALNEDLLEEVA